MRQYFKSRLSQSKERENNLANLLSMGPVSFTERIKILKQIRKEKDYRKQLTADACRLADYQTLKRLLQSNLLEEMVALNVLGVVAFLKMTKYYESHKREFMPELSFLTD